MGKCIQSSLHSELKEKGGRESRNLFFGLLVVLILLIAPQRLDGFEDTVSLNREVDETEDSNGSDDIQKSVAGGLELRGNVVFDDVMNTIPSVEGDNEGQNEIEGHVEEGGREKHTNRQNGCHGPRRELEGLKLHVLGSTHRLGGD